MFDSGSAVGGAIAPVLVVWLYSTFGIWRPAFLLTGLFGLVWLAAWRLVYREPNTQEENGSIRMQTRASCASLLRSSKTWGIVLGKGLTDPV